MDSANAYLEAQGHGPNNFSVPMKAGGETSTHAGLNCWDLPDFRACLDDMIASGDFVGMVIGADFNELATSQALDWSDPTNWTQNPVMKGDQRNHDGKLWESLLDFNVWTPPVGWREVVAQGYPAWVQPTGAHDAYALGAKVTHLGKNWESIYAANTRPPSVFGWVEIA
jgi:hypothetical protein